MAGTFIVLEGLDTSGKSYQSIMLKEFLEEKFPDKKIVLTREPGSHLVGIASKIRDILLHTEAEICSDAEMFLYASDRSQHVHEIKKLLEEDCIVICDRYFYSSLVYQGIAGDSDIDKLLNVNRIAISGLIPDLMFVMQIDIDEYFARCKGRDNLDRIERKGKEYFTKCIEGYNNLYSHFHNDEDLWPFTYFINAKELKEVNTELITGVTLSHLK